MTEPAIARLHTTPAGAWATLGAIAILGTGSTAWFTPETIRAAMEQTRQALQPLVQPAGNDSPVERWPVDNRHYAHTQLPAPVHRPELATNVQKALLATQEQQMLSLIDKLIFLREVPVFQELSLEQLRNLAAASDELCCAAGSLIVSEGAYGEMLFVIAEGRVAIRRRAGVGGEAQTLAVLGPHESFAEMSIFDDAPYSADAAALEPVCLITLRRSALMELIRRQPELALGFFRVLSQRLRRTNELIIGHEL